MTWVILQLNHKLKQSSASRGNRYPPKNYPVPLLPADERVRVEFSKITSAPALTRGWAGVVKRAPLLPAKFKEQILSPKMYKGSKTR